MIEVIEGGTLKAEFEYDGDGGRTKKTTYGSSTVVTKFIGSLYEERNAVSTQHIFLGDTRIASITGGATVYFHANHLGSSNLITDAGGVLKELSEYEPYGSFSRHEKYGTGNDVAWHYFTGQRFDDEIGLYYYGGRYYNSSLGRFLTPDVYVGEPSNPQNLNRYSYVYNNPINFVDPSGHFAWLAAFAFIAKAAAVVAKVATVVSIATTAIGLATQNQTLLNVGRISGFVALGAGLTSIGLNSVVASKAAAASQTAAIDLGTITIMRDAGASAAGQAAKYAAMAATAREVLQEAVQSTIGAFFSTGAAIAGTVNSTASEVGSIVGRNFVNTVRNFPQTVGNELRNAFYWPTENPVESAFLALGGTSFGVGFHATTPASARSIIRSGFQNSQAGRLGGGGVYVNNTSAGAIAEFRNAYPSGQYEVLSVGYLKGNNLPVRGIPENFRAYGNFPFSRGADTITHESLRAPGTINTLIKNNSTTPLR